MKRFIEQLLVPSPAWFFFGVAAGIAINELGRKLGQ